MGSGFGVRRLKVKVAWDETMKTVMRLSEAETEENRAQLRKRFKSFAAPLICQIHSYLL